MIITEAPLSDLTEIARLVNSAYRGDSSRVGWASEADMIGGQRTDPDTLREELTAGPERVILSLREVEGGPILACVLLEKVPEHDGRARCYLGMLTVEPTLQDRGLGRILLGHAEAYARDWGADRVVMTVIQLRDRLIAWYERRGYVKTGKTLPFPYGDDRFGIPNRDDLHFVVLEKPI